MARKDYLRITNSMRLHLSTSEWIDTNKPLDISIPIINNSTAVKAWYVDDPSFEPVRANGFVGSVIEGGSVNFRIFSLIRMAMVHILNVLGTLRKKSIPSTPP
jgi:hypothetical protein